MITTITVTAAVERLVYNLSNNTGLHPLGGETSIGTRCHGYCTPCRMIVHSILKRFPSLFPNCVRMGSKEYFDTAKSSRLENMNDHGYDVSESSHELANSVYPIDP
jgi:hypothetical protein